MSPTLSVHSVPLSPKTHVLMHMKMYVLTLLGNLSYFTRGKSLYFFMIYFCYIIRGGIGEKANGKSVLIDWSHQVETNMSKQHGDSPSHAFNYTTVPSGTIKTWMAYAEFVLAQSTKDNEIIKYSLQPSANFIRSSAPTLIRDLLINMHETIHLIYQMCVEIATKAVFPIHNYTSPCHSLFFNSLSPASSF